jgi:V8-like Glu-specific endopeptidase
VATRSVKKPIKINLHLSVSNSDGEAAELVIKKAVSKPPAEGTNPKTVKPRSDGAEAVSGFKLLAAETAEGAEEMKAPDTSGLPDIGEASFGPPPPAARTVHGVDNRIRITTTNVYPWRVHASLLITAADNSQWIGTGWFIGPHTLMTAGHVVFIKNSGVPGRDGWVKRIQVMPGRNAASLPYGSVTSSNFRSVTGWTGSGDENYDYGAIILPNNLGNTTGWFGFGVYSDADLKASVGNISGYPGDKPSGTQWYDARRIASVNSRKVFYDIDTFGGQSGSAVYRIINGGRYAVAIHAYGGAVTNSGTRIVTPVFNNMVAWKA